MNKVNHFEIPAGDVERAKKFYSEIFGWKMNPVEGMEYVIVETGPTDEKTGPTEPGFINGGIGKRPAGIECPCPDIVIDVENIDEYLEKIVAAGGSIVAKKMPVMEMGFTAYFKDPEGNIIGLWETKK